MKQLKIDSKINIPLPEFCSSIEIYNINEKGEFNCIVKVYDDGFYTIKERSYIGNLRNPIQFGSDFNKIKIPSSIFSFKHKGEVIEDKLILNDDIWNNIYEYIKNNLEVRSKFKFFKIDKDISLIFEKIASGDLWHSGYILGNCYIKAKKGLDIKVNGKKIETNIIFSESYDLYKILCPKLFFCRFPFNQEYNGFDEKDWKYISQIIRDCKE